MLWAKQAGGTDFEWAFDIAVDEIGRSYVVGSFEGTATFDGVSLVSRGGLDTFVASYDSLGSLRWVTQAGGGGHDIGGAIDVDSAGALQLAGLFNSSSTFGIRTVASAGSFDLFLATLGPEFRPPSIPPALTIRRGGSGPLLEWPGDAEEYILEMATALTSSTRWTPVSVAPVRVGNNWSVVESSLSSPKFYRLQKRK
jgi:hypothetical protein